VLVSSQGGAQDKGYTSIYRGKRGSPPLLFSVSSLQFRVPIESRAFERTFMTMKELNGMVAMLQTTAMRKPPGGERQRNGERTLTHTYSGLFDENGKIRSITEPPCGIARLKEKRI